jgi:hypothetical protein
VNHFPFGPTLQYFYYYAGPDGSYDDGTVYSLDQSIGVSFNMTDTLDNKVDCCNFVMSQGPAAWGIFLPKGEYPTSGPSCFAFNVRDENACDPSAVKFTLAYAPAIDLAPGQAYAL